MKFLVSCANGAGTSLMMRLTTEKVLKKLGIKGAQLHHCSISEGKSLSTQFDVVLCPLNFMPMFDHAKEKGSKLSV